MADTLTGAVAWSGDDVKVGDVLAALDRVRREAELRATRTRVVTLIAVAYDDADVEVAHAATHHLGLRHPARVVVLHADRGGPPRLDARVAVDESDDGRMWSEDVVLRVGGPAAGHLPSLVEPFTLADLPVVVWFVGALPDPDDELVEGCRAVVIDSKATGGAGRAQILELCRRRPVVDLSWVRLAPWRALLAGLFDGAEYRPFVRTVVSATVEGKDGPRHLLAGWLASRLGLDQARIHVERTGPAAIRLVARHEGRAGRFEVERAAGEQIVRARAVVDGGPHHHESFPLPDGSTARALSETLGRLGRDRVYEQALAAAP